MKTIATLFLFAATAQYAAASSLRARIKAEAAIHNYNSVMAGLLQADPPADPVAVQCAEKCGADFECYSACIMIHDPVAVQCVQRCLQTLTAPMYCYGSCTRQRAAALLQADPPASTSGDQADPPADPVAVHCAEKCAADFECYSACTKPLAAALLQADPPASTSANAAMGSLLRLTKLTESMLQKAADNAASDPDGLKTAIKNAQLTLGAALNSCAAELKGIKDQVQKAQLTYTRSTVMDTAVLVNASDDVVYWTMSILDGGLLTQLEITLEAALIRSASSRFT